MSESIREPAEFEVSPEGVVAAIEAEIQECGGADRYIKSLQLEPAYDPALNNISKVAAIIDSLSNDELFTQNSTIGDVFYRGALLGTDIAHRVLSEKRMSVLAEEIDQVFKLMVDELLIEDAEDVEDVISEIQRIAVYDMVPYIDLLRQHEQELFVDSRHYTYAHSGMAMVLLAMARVMDKHADELREEKIDKEVSNFAANMEDELDKLFKDMGKRE